MAFLIAGLAGCTDPPDADVGFWWSDLQRCETAPGPPDDARCADEAEWVDVESDPPSDWLCSRRLDPGNLSESMYFMHSPDLSEFGFRYFTHRDNPIWGAILIENDGKEELVAWKSDLQSGFARWPGMLSPEVTVNHAYIVGMATSLDGSVLSLEDQEVWWRGWTNPNDYRFLRTAHVIHARGSEAFFFHEGFLEDDALSYTSPVPTIHVEGADFKLERQTKIALGAANMQFTPYGIELDCEP